MFTPQSILAPSNVRFRSTFPALPLNFDFCITNLREISYTHVRLVFILELKPFREKRCDESQKEKEAAKRRLY
jgi:hypothetical protein